MFPEGSPTSRDKLRSSILRLRENRLLSLVFLVFRAVRKFDFLRLVGYSIGNDSWRYD